MRACPSFLSFFLDMPGLQCYSLSSLGWKHVLLGSMFTCAALTSLSVDTNSCASCIQSLDLSTRKD